MGIRRYRVYFTPLANVDSRTYGSEIEVSDRVEMAGVGNLKKSIDSADYDFGVFFFSDLTLKGYNLNGYFNDESDPRSIFQVTRDRCKVRVVYEDITVTRDANSEITDTSPETAITFNGLISEEATRLDAVTDQIQFKILSRDSVLRTTNIPGGVVASGSTFKTAIQDILNNPEITSILSFDPTLINPDLGDVTIDDGSVFDGVSVKDGLDQLLLASNSVLLIDDDLKMIVKSRIEDETRPIINLYGKSDQYGRENIVTITAYNSGKHRQFTSIKINETERSNQAFVSTFGFKQKVITLDFITDPTKERQIANRLLNEFKAPKIELAVQVPTSIARNARLLDRVSVNYPLRVKPPEGTFLPTYGSSVYGDPETPYPIVFGSISITRNTAFKIIEIEDNPKELLSILRLRQVGVGLDDGVFNLPTHSIYGFAKYGESKYRHKTNPKNFNPSVYGAGEYGDTEYGP
jgi:hypothetical protein